MTPRRSGPGTARTPRRLLALAAMIPLVVVMSACAPLSLFLGIPTPTSHETDTPFAQATPTRAPSASPTPDATPGCVDKTISQAGTYRIDACENLTIMGTGGIVITAGRLGTVTLRGDSVQLLAASITKLDVEGQLNNIQTSEQLGVVVIRGDRNLIASHEAISSVLVNGNDNTITADGGFGATIQDNGQRNTISASP